MNQTCKRACNATCSVSLYVRTRSEWHSKQALKQANFIAEIPIINPRNNELIIDCRRNNDHRSSRK